MSNDRMPDFPEWGAFARSFVWTHPEQAVRWCDQALEENARLRQELAATRAEVARMEAGNPATCAHSKCEEPAEVSAFYCSQHEHEVMSEKKCPHGTPPQSLHYYDGETGNCMWCGAHRSKAYP